MARLTSFDDLNKQYIVEAKYFGFRYGKKCVLINGIDVQKLGELEDVMERHNIESAEDLDHALDVLEAFKKCITIKRIDPPVEPILPDKNGDYIAPLSRYLVEVQLFNMDSALHKALTEWVMKNIDKETIFKWLGVYKGE